jgi:hypothetical protein
MTAFPMCISGIPPISFRENPGINSAATIPNLRTILVNYMSLSGRTVGGTIGVWISSHTTNATTITKHAKKNRNFSFYTKPR